MFYKSSIIFHKEDEIKSLQKLRTVSESKE